MRRMVIGALASAFALSVSAGAAHAAPKKKAAKAAAHQEAPQSAEIGKAMGDLKWGTSREDVLKYFNDQIKEKYKPLIAKSTGAIEEDKLRANMRDELGALKRGLVDFNGNKSGWDASFLKGEFMHNNGESMLVVKDSNSQNFYMFHEGKLWKWYKAFNAEAFQGKKFDQFADALQSRYGKAQAKEGELVEGQGKQRWLEWQDPQTRLRAVDNNQFYGFYCLVFENKDASKQIAELRKQKAEPSNKKHALVESVISDDSQSNDGNPDIIDRITGKIRHRQDAPAAATTTTSNGKPAVSAAAPAAATPPSKSVADEDDPLKGLL